MKYVVAIDLGTTGNRALAFSKDGRIAARSYYEFAQRFPKPGWVEHDPLDIWNTAKKALRDVLTTVGVGNIEAIGITNQRETTILWDKFTGKPVYSAIVWQDRRTQELCAGLSRFSNEIHSKTGLFTDPYFSGTKIKWIIDNVPGLKKRIDRGEILFGTVDTWVLWNLTGGKVHATEPSNASRTMLFDIDKLQFDKRLLSLLKIPASILPEVKQSADDFGVTDKKVTGKEIPITGILGDQQASLFANGSPKNDVIKVTYGTGLFLMVPTGTARIKNSGKLITTVASTIEGVTDYAVEGSVFVGGSCVQWLRDELRIIGSSSETEKMARSLPSNEGVYFVPALTGLGAPYWDPKARGMIIGITRGTKREHLARAALEAIAFQVKDVLDLMEKVTGRKYGALRVDGGAAKNDFLMQFQADILGKKIERPLSVETTALGAAGIAGIACGFWTKKQFLETRKIDKIFKPGMERKKSAEYYSRWKAAVSRALLWEK
jgi:glycerol kinase